MVPWGVYGAWLGLLAGGFGLLTLLMTFRTQARSALPIGTLLGLILTGSAGISLAAFLLTWGLSPF
jgi:hypothetical protein